MGYQTIRYDVADSILMLTLHRPDKLNAFTLQMSRELIDAFDRADADDEVRAIVVTGAGRAFCAGMDLGGGGNVFGLDEAVDPERDPEAIRDSGGRVVLRIFDLQKPVIAAINGPAVGIGITMTLAMDLRLASRDSKIGFVFTQRGISNEACSSWFLPRVVGVSQALEWVLSGRVFGAEEALAGGLVRSLHEREDVLEAATQLARELARDTSAVSVALCRQMIYKLMGADHPMEAHKIDSRAMFYTSLGGDGKEGVASFLEKRPAKFRDRVSRDMPPFYPWWEKRSFD